MLLDVAANSCLISKLIQDSHFVLDTMCELDDVVFVSNDAAAAANRSQKLMG